MAYFTPLISMLAVHAPRHIVSESFNLNRHLRTLLLYRSRSTLIAVTSVKYLQYTVVSCGVKTTRSLQVIVPVDPCGGSVDDKSVMSDMLQANPFHLEPVPCLNGRLWPSSTTTTINGDVPTWRPVTPPTNSRRLPSNQHQPCLLRPRPRIIRPFNQPCT